MRGLALASALVAGCAPYAPELGDRPPARVRVVSTYQEPVRAAVMSGDCVPMGALEWSAVTQSLSLLPGRGKPPERTGIGMPDTKVPPELSFSEHRVPAGTPLTLAFRMSASYGSEVGVYGQTLSTCTVAIRFTPRPHADYEAIYSIDPRRNRCSAIVREIQRGANGAPAPRTLPDVEYLPRC